MFHDLLAEFPNLTVGNGYRRTSDPTKDYNCLAWAMDDASRWWEPDPFGVFYWPDEVTRSYDIKNYIEVCKVHGFQLCKNGTPETGFEKLAIYTVNKGFTHVARQLPNGEWTSKLGRLDDISHALDGFEGSRYGQPTIFLRRKTDFSSDSGNGP